MVNEEEIPDKYALINVREKVDLVPSNIELSAVEISLVNTMSRELVLKSYIHWNLLTVTRHNIHNTISILFKHST